MEAEFSGKAVAICGWDKSDVLMRLLCVEILSHPINFAVLDFDDKRSGVAITLVLILKDDFEIDAMKGRKYVLPEVLDDVRSPFHVGPKIGAGSRVLPLRMEQRTKAICIHPAIAIHHFSYKFTGL
jgi:hypothetical protein